MGATPIDQGQTETVSSATVIGGSGTISYQLLSSAVSGGIYTNTGATCTPSGSTVTCSYSPVAGTYYYKVTATDSAWAAVTTTSSHSSAVTVNTALGAPGAPTVTTPIDQGQTETVSSTTVGGGSGTIVYQLLSSAAAGGTYTNTGATCTPSGSAVACSYSPLAGTYYYEVGATDSSSTPVTSTSPFSVAVTVNAALGTPAAPTGTTPIDQGQTETVSSSTVTSGSGTITYRLLSSTTSGGVYADTGATCTPSGAAVICSYSPASGTYYYKVTVTDQAAVPVTTTSPPSSAVTVNTALGAPGTPTATTPIDQGQTERVTAAVFGVDGTGTGPIVYALLASPSPYVSWAPTGATCTDVSGTLTCTYSPSAGTYEYEVAATDSSSAGAQTTTSSPSSVVTVSTALGTPSAPTGTTPIDQGQTETVSSTIVGGGSGTITYQLLSSGTSGGSYASTGASCALSGATVNCSYSPSAGTYYYKVTATDQATTPVTTTSLPSAAVTVNSALGIPGLRPARRRSIRGRRRR